MTLLFLTSVNQTRSSRFTWYFSFWRVIGNMKRRKAKATGGRIGWRSTLSCLAPSKASRKAQICHMSLVASPLTSSTFPWRKEVNKSYLAKHSRYSYWALLNPWHNMVSFLKLIKNKWQGFPQTGLTVHLHSAFQSSSLQGDSAKHGP